MREFRCARRMAGAGSLGFLATSWSTTAAFAMCGMAAIGGGGSGPPSISVTESSTTQVLEKIRKRTEETQQQPIPAVDTTEVAAPAGPAPAGTSSSGQSSGAPAGTSGGAAGQQQAQPKPVAQQKKVSIPQAAPSGGGSLKDDGVSVVHDAYGGYARTRAVWGQGFFDYERHEDIAPDSQENPTRRSLTGGGMVGADWTIAKQSASPEAFLVGVFTGYSNTRNEFSDTAFTADETDGTTATYLRTDNEQDIEGPFVGAYLAYSKNRITADLAFKADFFDLDQSSRLTQTCGDDTGVQFGSASVTNVMVAANVEKRIDVSANRWFAPTIGLRYTHTDYGSDTSTSVFSIGGTQDPGRLGLEDGDALRLQAGIRYGIDWLSPEGYLWTTTLGAFLYSDVLIDGFTFTGGAAGGTVGPVDEGKLRALGQLASRLDVGNGLSYMFIAEVRGGEDVIGVGGQLGMRYEW